MAAIRDIYRTNDGRYYFEFIFKDNGDCFHVYIRSQPSYGARSSDGHSTHRYEADYEGCKKRICFADESQVRTLNSARKYAEAWSECTAKYINTGKFEL